MKEQEFIPTFSIITVCWNDQVGLEKTYQSLLQQECKDFEWIVVDGNSTDASKLFLKGLPEGVCAWSSEPDNGLYDAMNKGLHKSTGRYVTFLNSGDIFADGQVLAVIKSEALGQDSPDFIYGDGLEHISDEENILKKARSHKWLWYGMFTHHQSMFYKRELIGSLKYRLEYKLAADYGFTTEFLKKSDEITYVPTPICVFEGGGLTSTGSAHILGMKEQWRVGRKLQGKSFVFSLATLSLHLMKHAALRLAPSIVQALRYKK